MECALNSDSEIVKSDGWVRFARLSVSSLQSAVCLCGRLSLVLACWLGMRLCASQKVNEQGTNPGRTKEPYEVRSRHYAKAIKCQ